MVANRDRLQGQSCVWVVSMALLARGENGERNTVDRMQVLNEGAKVGVIAV